MSKCNTLTKSVPLDSLLGKDKKVFKILFHLHKKVEDFTVGFCFASRSIGNRKALLYQVTSESQSRRFRNRTPPHQIR